VVQALYRPKGQKFLIQKKCRYKFDCLVQEMLLIRELTPSLNVQSDSIRVNYLGDSALIIYVNLQLHNYSWQFIRIIF